MVSVEGHPESKGSAEHDVGSTHLYVDALCQVDRRSDLQAVQLQRPREGEPLFSQVNNTVFLRNRDLTKRKEVPNAMCKSTYRHNAPLSQDHSMLIDVDECAICVRYTVGASSVVGSLNLKGWKLVVLSAGLAENVGACAHEIHVLSVKGDVVRIAPADANGFDWATFYCMRGRKKAKVGHLVTDYNCNTYIRGSRSELLQRSLKVAPTTITISVR